MTSKQSQEPDQPDQEKKKSSSKKLTETLDTLKKNESIETLYAYAKSNTFDTVAYIALVVGLIWMVFHHFYGGFLIGAIFGLYYSDEIARLVRHTNDFIEGQGMVRSIILGCVLLALLLSAFGMFVGTAIAVTLKQMIVANMGSSSKPGS